MIDKLIKDKLVKQRAADARYHCEPYMIKWTFANEHDLVFCVVYQELFQLQFIDELLSIFKSHFSKLLVWA